MSRLPSLNSIVTLFVIIIALLTGCSGNKKGETNRLREEFLDGCGDQSCWRGVRPGLTSGENALEAVNGAGVTCDFSGDPQQDSIWLCNWAPNDEDALYTWASMNVTDDIVSQIWFDTRVVCPADFITAFGEPDLVSNGDSSYGLYYDNELMLIVVDFTETVSSFGELYMFSEEFYIEHTTGLQASQTPWADVKGILTEECVE